MAFSGARNSPGGAMPCPRASRGTPSRRSQIRPRKTVTFAPLPPVVGSNSGTRPGSAAACRPDHRCTRGPVRADTYRIVDVAKDVALGPGELRERRQSLQLSQADLGRALGVTRNSVARWERGE